MPVEPSDFHLEEYKALRKEIEWLLKDYRALERNVAIVCGGLLAWLFEQKQSSQGWTPQDLAWIIPFLFAGLGSVRAWGILKAFDVYHEYIAKIEEAFSSGIRCCGTGSKELQSTCWKKGTQRRPFKARSDTETLSASLMEHVST